MTPAAARPMALARALWGVALLAEPEYVLRMVPGVTVDRKTTVIARVLGARHLLQGALSVVRPSRGVLAAGEWADAAHAFTAVALAVVDRGRVRAGLADAAVAIAWVGAGRRVRRRSTASRTRVHPCAF